MLVCKVGVASELSSDVANAIPSNFTDQATGSFNDAVSDVVTVWCAGRASTLLQPSEDRKGRR